LSAEAAREQRRQLLRPEEPAPAPWKEGAQIFIDPDGYKELIAKEQERFAAVLKKEHAAAKP
jgi:hypothetical protein